MHEKQSFSARQKRFTFLCIIEKDDDGYFAFCPELQGCFTQGDNYEDTLKNIKDAMKLHIEDRLATGEIIKQPEMTRLTEVAV